MGELALVVAERLCGREGAENIPKFVAGGPPSQFLGSAIPGLFSRLPRLSAAGKVVAGSRA